LFRHHVSDLQPGREGSKRYDPEDRLFRPFFVRTQLQRDVGENKARMKSGGIDARISRSLKGPKLKKGSISNIAIEAINSPAPKGRRVPQPDQEKHVRDFDDNENRVKAKA